MSFMDFLKGLFGGKKHELVRPGAGGVSRYGRNGMTAGRVPGMPQATAMAKQKAKSVYEGRPTPAPEWAEGMSSTDLVAEIPKHVKCRYVPSFERKKIMSTQTGADGNLIPEYDGVAGTCGAVKQFGQKVGLRNGQKSAFRYVDLSLCYRACCDIPEKCPFYLEATGEMDAVNSRRG